MECTQIKVAEDRRKALHDYLEALKAGKAKKIENPPTKQTDIDKVKTMLEKTDIRYSAMYYSDWNIAHMGVV